jgi:preprotein translocase SecE subunit
MLTFFYDSLETLKKVKKPTAAEITNMTITIFIVVIIAAIIFMVFDGVFASVYKSFYTSMTA